MHTRRNTHTQTHTTHKRTPNTKHAARAHHTRSSTLLPQGRGLRYAFCGVPLQGIYHHLLLIKVRRALLLVVDRVVVGVGR